MVRCTPWPRATYYVTMALLWGTPIAMAERPVVVIAPAHAVRLLRGQPGFGRDILIFLDTEPFRALEAITAHRPDLVGLDREFLASSPAAALINRIRTDPLLSHTQIRVLSTVDDYTHLVRRRAQVGLPPAIAVPGEPLPPDYQGVRRSLRFRMRTGVEVKVDGDPATLVDLSRDGAQVLVEKNVRPSQRVRMSMTDEHGLLRCHGSIIWAAFERSGQPATEHYRAGVVFMDANAERVEAFSSRHRRL